MTNSAFGWESFTEKNYTVFQPGGVRAGARSMVQVTCASHSLQASRVIGSLAFRSRSS